MPINQTARPPAGGVITLAHHVVRDGEVKSTAGFIAVNRIKRLIRAIGHRGMITVSDLIGADPSLSGLDRPEILDQIIAYGKFDTMEIGGDIYVTTGMRNVSVPARKVPRLRMMFMEARARTGPLPLVAAIQGSGRHVDDLAHDRVWSLRRLVSEVGKELDRLDAVNGVIGEIRNNCSGRVQGESVQVSRVKSSTPELAWISTGLLGCILATDGSGRQLYLSGKDNRRLVVSTVLPSGKRIRLPEPSIEIKEEEDVEPIRVMPQSVMSQERADHRRTRRRQRLWERILKASELSPGRVQPAASWQRRLPRSRR